MIKISYNNTGNKKTILHRFEGFRLEWIVNGCGGPLNKEGGEFSSPEYPGNYLSNISCEWTIVTSPGNTINIVIQDFSFESVGICDYDYLAVSVL